MTADPVVSDADDHVAIVGMAGRFPGAASIDELWELSVNGRSGLSATGDRRPGYVPTRGVVAGTDHFDAGYFGIPEREARLLDPQQRVLLEVAQHAFDHAAIDYRRARNVAVYVACAPQPPSQGQGSLAEQYERQLAGEAGFAAMRLCYRLGLRGEGITVETACSSSLTAVHLACQSLLSGQADTVLAGGVSITLTQDVGYLVESGMITSPSGRCVPFDEAADGTVPGSGAGLVVLKRLADALRDHDTIRAVIIGTAVNNDGATKVGFMAPSPDGQAEVIATAHAVAGIRAGSVGYVETHGTATRIGDAVEIEGLRRSFELDGSRTQPCALGSLKANCGHLDRAAGVAGLIRATLALAHRTIPPMAGFSRPGPALDLDAAGFTVPTSAVPWATDGRPRCAGVSAFGVGGTNVHVVVQEAPASTASTASPAVWATRRASGPVPLVVSGYTPKATRQAAEELASYLEREQPADIVAIARALAAGRRQREYRSCVVADSWAEAAAELRQLPEPVRGDIPPTVVFAFAGQGPAVVEGLGGLYASEPVFAQALDEHAAVLAARTGRDIRTDLYGDPPAGEETFADLRRFQTASLAVQLALCRLWSAWGVTPDAVLGHSLGEVAAAACAGVFSYADALSFITQRSAVMYDTRPGVNLSVALPAAELAGLLPDGVTISALNGASLTTVTGRPDQIAVLAGRLAAEGAFYRYLNINISPHGPAMLDAADKLYEHAARLALTPPAIMMLSNLTGDWESERLASPGYWRDHLVSPVRFADQLERLRSLPSPLVIAIGTDQSLSRMISHELGADGIEVIPSAGGGTGADRDRRSMLLAAARAWCHGAELELEQFLPGSPARADIPVTRFDHAKRWPAQAPAGAARHGTVRPARHEDPGAWLYEPGQRKSRDGTPGGLHSLLAWAGSRDRLAESVERAAQASGKDLIPYEQAADHGRTSPVDVLWPIGDADQDLLTRAWEIASQLQAGNRGSRVWMIVSPAAAEPHEVTPTSLALAAVRVLPQEVPGIGWYLVEVDGDDVAGHLLDLISAPPAEPVLRVTQDVTTHLVFEHAWPDWRARPMRERGCYLITGGMGLVGRALAVAIARETRASIVLTGRRPEAEVAADLGALSQTLAATGSAVTYATCDVTQEQEVARLCSALREQYGRIDGVIHAAGLTDRNKFTVCRDSSADRVAAAAAAKLAGCVNIAAALTPDDADFVLLCSSLSVVLGGLRFGPYVAANACLEEFARQRRACGDKRWLAVAWDAWREASTPAQAGPARYALIPEDGHAVFRRLLSVRSPVVYVSTAELGDRIAEISTQLADGFAEASEWQEADGTAAPAESIEKVVETILLSTLGEIPDDPERDLHGVGVESLTVLQIVTRLQNALGVKIPLGEVFGSLSTSGLISLAQRHSLQPGELTHPGKSVARTAIEVSQYEASALQRRWLDLLDEGYGGLDLAIEVTGDVTADALGAAVAEVIERHSGLRTTFHRAADGTWQQAIGLAQPVRVIDLSHLQRSDQDDRLTELVTAAIGRPFDVSRTPPFEVTVARLGPARNAILLHAHHVMFDGWSSSIFLRDVSRAIKGELTAKAPQYIEYAQAQAAYLNSSAADQDREYWRLHFHGASGPTRVTSDFNVMDDTDRGAYIELRFGPELAHAMRQRAASNATTAFALMMSAYGLLLHSICHSDDLIVGTTAAGRPTVNAEETVGVFVSPLPLRIQVNPHERIQDLISRTHEALLGFHEHINLPLAEFVASIEPFIGMGLNDTFQCYLLYQNYWRPASDKFTFGKLPLGIDEHHKLMRELEIVMEDDADALHGELWYRPTRISRETAVGWGEFFGELLRAVSVEPSDLSVAALITECVQRLSQRSQNVFVRDRQG